MSKIVQHTTFTRLTVLVAFLLVLIFPAWEASLPLVIALCLVGVEMYFEKRHENEIANLRADIQKLKDRVDSLQLGRLAR